MLLWDGGARGEGPLDGKESRVKGEGGGGEECYYGMVEKEGRDPLMGKNLGWKGKGRRGMLLWDGGERGEGPLDGKESRVEGEGEECYYGMGEREGRDSLMGKYLGRGRGGGGGEECYYGMGRKRRGTS